MLHRFDLHVHSFFSKDATGSPEALIAAPGTSCRHQIRDATGRVALHPVEILHDALVP